MTDRTINFTEEQEEIIKEIYEEEGVTSCEDLMKCKILEMVELRKATNEIRKMRKSMRVGE